MYSVRSVGRTHIGLGKDWGRVTKLARLERYVDLHVLTPLTLGTAVAVLTFAVDAIAIHLLGAKNHILAARWFVDALSGVIAAILFWVRSIAMKMKLAEVDAYQASAYLQQMRIRSAVQVISHVNADCTHIGDPAHKNCTAAMRRELMVIQAAIGRAPNPEIIRGKKETGT